VLGACTTVFNTSVRERPSFQPADGLLYPCSEVDLVATQKLTWKIQSASQQSRCAHSSIERLQRYCNVVVHFVLLAFKNLGRAARAPFYIHLAGAPTACGVRRQNMALDMNAESGGVSTGAGGSYRFASGDSGKTMMIFVAIVAVAVAIVYHFSFSQRFSPLQTKKSPTPPKSYAIPVLETPADLQVPFVVLTKPDFKVLHRNLEAHRNEMQQALQHLSQALEVALQAEESILTRTKFSDHLRDKLHRLAAIYEADQETLERVLAPFSAKLMLTSASSISSSTTMEDNQQSTLSSEERNNHLDQSGFTWWRGQSRFAAAAGVQPYDAPGQVIAHLVRDWSTEGRLLRESLYTWCLEQLQKYPFRKDKPILVPGAGLGRLAWELSTKLEGCVVEAIESSLCMAAAAYCIFNKRPSFHLHAYSMDPFSNEIDSSLRYERVFIPDVDPTLEENERFSFTVGDFNYEYMNKIGSQYGAVVTCFFIDTATTVYDYLTTIEAVLVDGGLWVNVGPLQWHRNNQLPVAVDELRLILETFCSKQSRKPAFDILFWQVDSQPVNYRAEGKLRSTHFDAYCPLRFVLRKSKQ